MFVTTTAILKTYVLVMKLYICCYTGAIAPNVLQWELVKEVSVFRKYSTGHFGTYLQIKAGSYPGQRSRGDVKQSIS